MPLSPKTVLLIDPDGHTRNLVETMFPDATVVSEAMLKPGILESHFDLCVVGIALTKGQTTDESGATIRTLSQSAPCVMYFEPSSCNHARLAELELASFHSRFSGNKNFGLIDFRLFENALAQSSIKVIEEYASDFAADSKSHWIVSDRHPTNVLPSQMQEPCPKPTIVFDFIVYQFSWFVTHRFDSSIQVSPPPNSTLMTMKVINSNSAAVRHWMTESDANHLDGDRGEDISQNASSETNNIPSTVRFGTSHFKDISSTLPGAFEEYARVFTAAEIKPRVVQRREAMISGTGLIIGRRGVVAETRYLSELISPSIWGVVQKGFSQLVEPPCLYDACVVGLNAVAGNYYHWVAQCLVAITLACTSPKLLVGAKLALVVVPRLNSWQKDSLQALLASLHLKTAILELGPSEFVSARDVFYLTILGAESPFFHHIGRREMVYAVQATLSIPEQTPSEQIYISRMDSNHRSMTNEPELIAALSARGVRIVTMSGLSFKDQVSTAHRAKLIIGAHGAGLTNTLFAQRGTVLYELHQSRNLNSCMLRLAHSMGVNYVSDIFPSGEGSGRGTWTVDIDVVLATLSSLSSAC